jgi:hypothetical protein
MPRPYLGLVYIGIDKLDKRGKDDCRAPTENRIPLGQWRPAAGNQIPEKENNLSHHGEFGSDMKNLIVTRMIPSKQAAAASPTLNVSL